MRIRNLLQAGTLLAALGACDIGGTGTVPDRAAPPTVLIRPEPRLFSGHNPDPVRRDNTAMIRDFLDLSFNLETGHRLAHFTRVEGPVTLRVTGNAPATFQHDLASLLRRLDREAGIRITPVTTPDATVTINLVPQSDLNRLQPQAACFVVPNVADVSELSRFWRPARTDWRQITQRDRLVLVIPADAPPQEVRDCLHEEMAQALGPLNDLYRLPDSIFNDDNVHTVLTGFDMLMLRITYAPELRSGMTREQVAARLPALFARHNPGGERPAGPQIPHTTRAWARAIGDALSPKGNAGRRADGARRALREAQKQGWTDHRLAFSYLLAGRAAMERSPTEARNMITQADRIYAGSPIYRLPRLRTQGQLAAFDIEAGDPQAAIARLDPAIRVARNYQNAALLTELMVLKSEALIEMGRRKEATRLRLDTLGWASYGFGDRWAFHANVEIVPVAAPQQKTED